jgi:hypothetical protein
VEKLWAKKVSWFLGKKDDKNRDFVKSKLGKGCGDLEFLVRLVKGLVFANNFKRREYLKNAAVF